VAEDNLVKRHPLVIALMVVVALLLSTVSARAVCYQSQADADADGATVVRIFGSIYTGAMNPTTLLAEPAPAAGPITNATVMVQNMEEGGAFECYAKVTGNQYEAFVKEGEEYVVMFSAPGHDVTSREFEIPLGTAANILGGTVAATDFMQDAFLPPRDPVTGELPRGNLLVYAFTDNYVNSEDDFPIDTALAGVHFYVFDEDGNFEADGVSGSQTPAQMPPFYGPDIQGLYYFTNLKPGEHHVMALPPGVSPDLDPLTGQPVLNCQIDPTSSGWFWLTSEEGTQCWEVVLRPNDPGTLLGGYIPWFAFVKHIGQHAPFTPPPDNPTAPNTYATISGTLWDADGTDPAEVIDSHEVPQICYYEHQGQLFIDFNTGYHPDYGQIGSTIPGDTPDPNAAEDCVYPNVTMDRGYVILWDQNAVSPGVVATALADPVTGTFQFTNVPPGNYKVFTVDWPDDYIWTEAQVTVQPGVDVTNFDFYIPRFFARLNGHVTNDTTGQRLDGLKINLRTKDGGVWKSQITAPGTSGVGGEPVTSGYFNFDELAEIEVTAYVDVDYHTMPSNLRGVIDTDTYCYDDMGDNPPTHICKNYDLSTRDIGWFTANYRTELHLEEIPPTEGYIIGSVFNDHLSYDPATGTWHGNGILDEKEDRLLPKVTVKLIDANTNIIVATTQTGYFTEDRAVAQGHVRPYTPKGFILAPEPPYNVGDIEVDEWGGIFKGERFGQYEFRGVAPGNYIVQVVVPDGYSPSPAGSDTKAITVVGGQRNDVDFGVNTLVPLAGEIEGGVFDDVFIDNNHQSILWLEKRGIPHVNVGIYDHLGYKLGQGFMGNPLCYSPQPPISIGGRICPLTENLGQKPEVERRAAPGVHVYLANDPTLPGYNDQYVPLYLNYTFGQGQFKFEADWSLLPVSFIQPLGPGAILPTGGPIIGGGIMLVKNYGPTLPDGGVFKNAVYDASNPLKVVRAGHEKKKKKKKKKKKEHSKHKMKEKEGHKGGKEVDEDHDKKDDHDKEIEDAHNEQVQHGDAAVSSVPYAITGTNFGDLQGHSTVSLSGQELPVTSWSDTQIVVQIPSTAISGPLIVATTHGISNSIHVDVTPATPEWAAYLAERTIYVDASAMPGAGDGSQTAPYATITEALNNLPGVRPVYIMVAPGNYNENVRIKDSDIKIIGSGPFASMIDGLVTSSMNPLAGSQQGPYTSTAGPTFYIGGGGMGGAVSNVMISGFTITGGVPGSEGPGGGIFADYGNTNIDINNNVMARNGGEYGGAIWMHKTNHNVRIWSNLIAENGNFGGYGGGITANDEPEYGPPAPPLDHSYDDALYETPPGTYEIFNNLIFHNYSPDYGGGIALYEVKDKLNVYGNVIMENRSDDHGGGIFFEDTGPVDLYDNVFLRNFATDDGGAISFEDVADNNALVRIYNNLIAENIADDRGENSARGAGISFDDTPQAEVFNNTITGNIVAGSFDPTGGAIDSERHGHEYDAQSASPRPPYFSDVKVYNNIIWNNYRLFYSTSGIGEDLDYRYGTDYQWSVNNIHVDNPALNQPWQTDQNSESLSYVVNNDIEGGEYGTRTGNMSIDPVFTDPATLDWHLLGTSPVIGVADASKAPALDMDLRDRTLDGKADMGAMEYSATPLSAIRVPVDLLGNVEVPVFGTTQLHPPTTP